MFLQFHCVLGHGYLITPPARASAWRKGFDTPIDYDDNGLNCGGFGVRKSDWQRYYLIFRCTFEKFIKFKGDYMQSTALLEK